MDDLDIYALTRELDRVKAKVFIGSNAAFLGSLQCSMTFHWDRSVPTAQTDGSNLYWNPDWFLQLPFETRKTVLVHELWHPGRLHMLRIGSRDPEIWNYACDIRINNDLYAEGYSFAGTSPWMDPSIDANGRMTEEDIYDLLLSKQLPPPTGSCWDSQSDGNASGQQQDGPSSQKGDMRIEPSQSPATLINTVVRAMTVAKAAKQAGNIPAEISQLIDRFLAPVIPWEAELQRFFTDLLDETYSWSRPNRRHLYSGLYLPSKITDDGRLEHLMYVLDVSGSVSDQEVLRFNSEVKYIKETFNPEKLTLVQFSTTITAIDVFTAEDPFEKIIVVGRGGTNLEPVRKLINKEQPTAAIIFSDLDCAPMQPLDYEIPVIWVGVRAAGRKVPFGKLIHIRN